MASDRDLLFRIRGQLLTGCRKTLGQDCARRFGITLSAIC
jgi:hypothetical protein